MAKPKKPAVFTCDPRSTYFYLLCLFVLLVDDEVVIIVPFLSTE